MPYTIYKSNGSDSITVPDQEINTQFYTGNLPEGPGNIGKGILLIGRESANFGSSIDQNFLQITENFASPTGTQPSDLVALQGQLWYDTTISQLYVRRNQHHTGGMANWDAITGAIASGVNSFNTRTGAVTLTSLDVTDALGFTPSSGGVTAFNTRTGSITLTSSDVTTALGYTPSSGGTVDSVGLSLPSDFIISNSPVTTVGTLTAVRAPQSANSFLAAPNGASGVPIYRSIVPFDIPTLNQNTTGVSSNVSGIVAISNGGTGQNSQQLGLNALTNVAAATNEFVLTKDTASGNALWKIVSPTADFIAAGAGAVTRTMQDKARDFISILDFGADPTGATDSATAIQDAIDALPIEGGRIIFPDGNYLLSFTPAMGIKSVYLDIGTGCIFTGAGTGPFKFPYMTTNGGQLAVGPYIRSQTSQHSADSNGGIAALNVEMLQPSTYGAGQSVAIYAGSHGSSSDPAANVWAINCLIEAQSGAAGVYQCIEVDVNCNSPSALVKGIAISGIGGYQPRVALEILRNPAAPWQNGIELYDCDVGLRIHTANNVPNGIIIGAPSAFTNTPIAAQQTISSGDTIVVQRLTSATSGTFLKGVDETNSTTLFNIDATGGATFQGIVQCLDSIKSTQLILNSAAVAVTGADVCFGNDTSISATAGTMTLPNKPVGFLSFFIGSTEYKLPYYNV